MIFLAVLQEILLQQVMSHIGSVKKDMIILEKSEFSSLKHEYEVCNANVMKLGVEYQHQESFSNNYLLVDSMI